MAYLGRYEDSVKAYEEGLKLDPNNAQLKDGLAEVQAQLMGPFPGLYFKTVFTQSTYMCVRKVLICNDV